MAILTIASINIRWGKSTWQGTIGSDGKGYYCYLPAFLIYKDIHYGFLKEAANPLITSQPDPEFRVESAGNIVNKYPAGEAVLILPFFLIAHLITILTGNVADGYSYFYFIFVSIAALFYAWMGLYYTNKLLKGFNFSSGNIVISILVITFGTQLFLYIVSEPSMSHVFSFGLISGFFFYTFQYFKEMNFAHLFKVAILMGLIILVRPVNIFCLAFVPFLATNWASLSAGSKHLLNQPKNLILIFCTTISFAFIQLIIWKIQTGNFLIDTYTGEYFQWEKGKNLIPFLFSYKKGLLIYTPILLMCFVGFIPLIQQNIYQAGSLMFALGITFFIFASWWCWWYGWSFSSRPVTEYMSVFAILCSVFLTNLKSLISRRITIIILFGLIIFTQIQIFQYRHGFIDPENMTKEKYWDNFLRIDKL